MSEAWYKEFCPDCDAVNWICNGDESDLSSIDIEGYKCRKCGKIHFLGDEELYKFDKKCGGWESIEDCNWELGLEKPR